jgi:tetratricopeptide (TPR) repeat protein
MSKACLSFAAAFAVVLVASVAQAGQSWQGAQVMPSSAEVSLQADDGSTTSLYDISWPATVTRTKGRYLWVQDDGGYSRTQSGGWVYCDDVVRLDGASDHFSTELRKRESAWLYWMRGICWESKGEPGIAIADFQNALRVEPNTTLDDVHIRIGRLFAQEQLLNGRGKYDPTVRKVWEGHFQAAQTLNANRPQLYYEWGFALSQACACTLARPAAARKTSTPRTSSARTSSPSDNSAPKTSEPEIDKQQPGHDPAKTHKASGSDANRPIDSNLAENSARKTRGQLVVMRGIDPDDDTPSELPRPTKGPKTTPAPKTPSTPSTTSPSTTTQSHPRPTHNSSASEPITAGIPAGPTPAGSEAAVQALIYYETAEGLSPNWWRLPLARAELMLNQCDLESPRGDRVVMTNAKPEFLTQLLEHHKVWKARKSDPSTPPTNALASRGGDDDIAASGDSSNSAAKTLPAPTVDVLSTAIDDFNRSISLNPNALDAYRDRAEALRLANRMDEAEQSATKACDLCYYRQARTLRTLAQIYNDTGRYQPAADYALRAAELTSGPEQQRFLVLWDMYNKNATGESKNLAVASSRAGFVASRGGGDDDDNNGASTTSKPAHVQPPPGFFSRAASAVPE